MHLRERCTTLYSLEYLVFDTQNNMTYMFIIIYISPRLYMMLEMLSIGKISSNLSLKNGHSQTTQL